MLPPSAPTLTEKVPPGTRLKCLLAALAFLFLFAQILPWSSAIECTAQRQRWHCQGSNDGWGGSDDLSETRPARDPRTRRRGFAVRGVVTLPYGQLAFPGRWTEAAALADAKAVVAFTQNPRGKLWIESTSSDPDWITNCTMSIFWFGFLVLIARSLLQHGV